MREQALELARERARGPEVDGPTFDKLGNASAGQNPSTPFPKKLPGPADRYSTALLVQLRAPVFWRCDLISTMYLLYQILLM